MLLDAATLPPLTINLEYADTGHETCRAHPLDLFGQFTRPGAEYAGYGYMEVNVSVFPIPDDIDKDWWKTPESYWMRQKVRRAVKLGYAFAPFEYNDHLDDIYEINTSMDSRQGRQMTESYRQRPEPREPWGEQPCPRHHFGYFGIFKDGRLVAYTLVAQSGEMMQFSQILGHGAHMEDGVMNLLIFEAVKWHQERARTPYAVYYLHDSGTSGLQFFKRKMGFAGHLVRWELARPGVAAPALDAPAPDLPLGDLDWRAGARGTRVAGRKDIPRIQGYAGRPSVAPGEPIDFHIDVRDAEDFSTSIYRIGHYGGRGAEHLLDSPPIEGSHDAEPQFDDETGLTRCDWAPSWRLDVPEDWRPGLYLAAFTSASGWRAYAPFVVRGTGGELGIVLPFLSYQAANRWPVDGVHGRSLVVGHLDGGTTAKARAFEVSFDRPFDHNGLPPALLADFETIAWLETTGHELAYATDVDLHSGDVDAAALRGLVFCGQTEYWTRPLRDAVARAAHGGTGLAFLGSSAAYWHARLASSPDGRPDRRIACYKSDPDPAAGAGSATTPWRRRTPGPGEPEQELVGVQFAGTAARPSPLVVAEAGHWLWAGTGLADGDEIAGLVVGRVDAIDPKAPQPRGRRTILARSPFTASGATTSAVHHATVCELLSGASVFASGTQAWPQALGGPGADERVRQATANVLERLLAPRRPATLSVRVKVLSGGVVSAARDRLRLRTHLNALRRKVTRAGDRSA